MGKLMTFEQFLQDKYGVDTVLYQWPEILDVLSYAEYLVTEKGAA